MQEVKHKWGKGGKYWVVTVIAMNEARMKPGYELVMWVARARGLSIRCDVIHKIYYYLLHIYMPAFLYLVD